MHKIRSPFRKNNHKCAKKFVRGCRIRVLVHDKIKIKSLTKSRLCKNLSSAVCVFFDTCLETETTEMCAFYYEVWLRIEFDCE